MHDFCGKRSLVKPEARSQTSLPHHFARPLYGPPKKFLMRPSSGLWKVFCDLSMRPLRTPWGPRKIPVDLFVEDEISFVFCDRSLQVSQKFAVPRMIRHVQSSGGIGHTCHRKNKRAPTSVATSSLFYGFNLQTRFSTQCSVPEGMRESSVHCKIQTKMQCLAWLVTLARKLAWSSGRCRRVCRREAMQKRTAM